MSITIQFHDPISATAQHFEAIAESPAFSVVRFKDARRNDVALFCAPHVAEALAEAFNAAMKSEVAA